jgi:hypothetical protein
MSLRRVRTFPCLTCSCLLSWGKIFGLAKIENRMWWWNGHGGSVVCNCRQININIKAVLNKYAVRRLVEGKNEQCTNMLNWPARAMFVILYLRK